MELFEESRDDEGVTEVQKEAAKDQALVFQVGGVWSRVDVEYRNLQQQQQQQPSPSGLLESGKLGWRAHFYSKKKEYSSNGLLWAHLTSLLKKGKSVTVSIRSCVDRCRSNILTRTWLLVTLLWFEVSTRQRPAEQQEKIQKIGGRTVNFSQFSPLGWCSGSCRWREPGWFCCELPWGRACGCSFAETVPAESVEVHPGGSARCQGHRHTGMG